MSLNCCGTTQTVSEEKACVLEAGVDATSSHSPRGRPLRLKWPWGSVWNSSDGGAQIKKLTGIYDPPRHIVDDQ
jgi:hypothetical protein